MLNLSALLLDLGPYKDRGSALYNSGPLGVSPESDSPESILTESLLNQRPTPGGEQTFPVKDPVVNILGFAGHMVSVAALFQL